MIVQTNTVRSEHPEIMLWCEERGILINLISGGTDTNRDSKVSTYSHLWSVDCDAASMTMFCLRWPAKLIDLRQFGIIRK